MGPAQAHLLPRLPTFTPREPDALTWASNPATWLPPAKESPLCLRQPPGQAQLLPRVVSQCHTPMKVLVGSPVTRLLCRMGYQVEGTTVLDTRAWGVEGRHSPYGKAKVAGPGISVSWEATVPGGG